MPKFPTKESDVYTLSSKVHAGLNENQSVFPDPPVSLPALSQALNAYVSARNAAMLRKSELEAANALKQEKYNDVVSAVKKELRYCSRIADGDADIMSLVGWWPRKPPEPIEAPGSPLNLRVALAGTGELTLQWDKPGKDTGGPVRLYVIKRREQDPQGVYGPWQVVGSAFATELTLTGQPQDTRMDYQVFSRNSSGDSLPTASVSLIL